MRGIFFAPVLALMISSPLPAACLDEVAVGDPSFVVIEKCGQPQRREREEIAQTKRIEVVRGSERSSEIPVQPRVVEAWYYDTSLNAATVIRLEDGGVTSKERLRREE